MKFLVISLIVLVVICSIVGLAIVPFTGLHIETGKGEHTGFVTAIEKAGLFWKTGKVYIKTDLSSSQEDIYCVFDNEVYGKLEQALREKKPVTVQHRSVLVNAFDECNGEAAYITNIK